MRSGRPPCAPLLPLPTQPTPIMIKHYLQFTVLSAADYTYLIDRAGFFKRKFKA